MRHSTPTNMADLFIRLAEHLDIPGVVRVNELTPALSIGELCVHQKARAGRVRMS
jgi:hypothetical protein